MKFPKNALSCWDEGQKRPYYHWYRKGWWKRHYRKKMLKREIEERIKI